MNFVRAFFICGLVLNLLACGESSERKAHRSLANDFVNTLNMNSNYNVSIVKTHTYQDNFVVVYDDVTGTYDAYNLTNYSPGDDIYEFLDVYSNSFFFDVDRVVETYLREDPFASSFDEDGFYIGPTLEWVQEVNYIDPITGVRFSKRTMTPADTAKAQELVDGLKLQRASEQLMVQFGLSPVRANEVAGLALQLANADASKMTVYQYDQYAQAILGTSISRIHSAMDSLFAGDTQAVEKVYDQAAKANGISKSSVKKLAETFLF